MYVCMYACMRACVFVFVYERLCISRKYVNIF